VGAAATAAAEAGARPSESAAPPNSMSFTVYLPAPRLSLCMFEADSARAGASSSGGEELAEFAEPSRWGPSANKG